ncbi:MAG: DUF3887 domain-containing protein, partial [Chloroflexi bacterium]|nr:DUF3887 domain-containing protein [Chloroflexota bacterium]
MTTMTHRFSYLAPISIVIVAVATIISVAACSNEPSTPTVTATATTAPTLAPSPITTATATPIPRSTPVPSPTPRATPNATEVPETSPLEEFAIELVMMMVEQRFAEAATHLDATMTELMPGPVLAQAWGQIEAQAGVFQRIERTQSVIANPYTVVVLTTVFEGFPLNIEITFDTERKIAGLFFRPADEYSPPAYTDTGSFTEIEVVVGEAPWELSG